MLYAESMPRKVDAIYRVHAQEGGCYNYVESTVQTHRLLLNIIDPPHEPDQIAQLHIITLYTSLIS